jgi:tetratricopeptide (TPR) repeat protein
VSALALTGFGYVLNLLIKPPPVVIEQIYIPSNFEERGLKSDILVQRILDQIQVLRTTAKIDKAESAAFGNLATKPDAEIDASLGGLSLKSIEQLIITVFEKKPKKISGDIINIGSGDDVVLQTKLRHGNLIISSQELSLKNNNVDTLINKLAFDLYRHFEPFRASLAAYRLGRKDEAREALRPLLSSPVPEERKYALWLRSQLVQPQQQELDLLEAINIDPKFGLSLVSLSALERDRKNYAASHSYADRAIDANSKSPMGYHEKGRTYRAEQKLDEALQSFKKACTSDPDYAPCHNQIGEIYLMKVDQNANSTSILRDAYGEFAAAIKIDPTHPWAYSNAAYAALRLGDVKEAQILIRRAIEIDPDNPAHTIRLAGIYYKVGDKDQAKETITKLLPTIPEWEKNPPPGWGNRAIIREALR